MKARASHLLSMLATIELHPQPFSICFNRKEEKAVIMKTLKWTTAHGSWRQTSVFTCTLRPEGVCGGHYCSFVGTEVVYFSLDLDISVYHLWATFIAIVSHYCNQKLRKIIA